MHFITVFKSELSHTCTLVVDFGDLITKIYQSRRGILAQRKTGPARLVIQSDVC